MKGFLISMISFLSIVITFSIVLLVNVYIIENPRFNAIEKIFESFDKNPNLIYSYGTNSFYLGNRLNIYHLIEWIDDNHIIYSEEEDNNKNYYLIDSNENTSLLYSSNDLDEYGIIYKDSILYFISSDNTYNKYDNNTLTKIDKDEYYLIRDGNRYKVDINYKNDSNEIESLSVKDNGVDIYFDKEKLLSNSLVKQIFDLNDFKIECYYVFNDILYIQIKSDKYYIMLSYVNNIVHYCDCSILLNSNKSINCFLITSNPKNPILKYIINYTR